MYSQSLCKDLLIVKCQDKNSKICENGNMQIYRKVKKETIWESLCTEKNQTTLYAE